MAINFPGPYQLRIGYAVTPTGLALVPHVMQLNINLVGTPDGGTPFTSIDAVQADAGTVNLATYVDNWIDALKPCFSSTTQFGECQLWRYAPLSFDATFISSYGINEAGTAVSGAQPAGQVLFVYRTREGGVMKLSLMESTRAAGSPDYPPVGIAEWQTVDNFIRADTNCFLGRDTSYPETLTAVFPGQNEALFKKRYR